MALRKLDERTKAPAHTGTFTYEDRTVRVSGTGQRERYVAVESSAAELSAWEDWGYVALNEPHSSLYDMRLGMKDFSVYDRQRDKHYCERPQARHPVTRSASERAVSAVTDREPAWALPPVRLVD
nr:hypothetical protein [Actinomyces sp.]